MISETFEPFAWICSTAAGTPAACDCGRCFCFQGFSALKRQPAGNRVRLRLRQLSRAVSFRIVRQYPNRRDLAASAVPVTLKRRGMPRQWVFAAAFHFARASSQYFWSSSFKASLGTAFCHRLVHRLSRLLLLRGNQLPKRLGHLLPQLLERCLHQLTHAFAAARASGQWGCERCQPSQPGFKHRTGMSLWYAVFIGFSAKAIASALVVNHARSVPLDRQLRVCEFIVKFRSYETANNISRRLTFCSTYCSFEVCQAQFSSHPFCPHCWQ
jgi:hypothetical protein